MEHLLQTATRYEANNKDRCFINGSKDGPSANVATAGRGKPIAKFNAFFQQLKKEGRCFRCMEKGGLDHKTNCVGLKSTCSSCHKAGHTTAACGSKHASASTGGSVQSASASGGTDE